PTPMNPRSSFPDDAVEMARTLVSIPSVNPDLAPDGTGEGDVARQCRAWLEGWGFEVDWVEPEPGRPSLVARLGEGRPRTILNGHLDTVGVEGMPDDPFDPRMEDGLLFGRGSCDMKAGVAAMLAVARSVARRRALRPDSVAGELLVVLTADEEQASIGLRALLDRGLEADRAVVTEPTSLAIAPANRGFVWVHVEVEGVAAHGSRPDVGRDAIRGAGRLLAELDQVEAALAEGHRHPLLTSPSIHAGTIRGGTSPSVYPHRCSLVLEARTLPGMEPAQVMAAVEAAVARVREQEPDLTIHLREGLSRPPAELPGSHPLVQDLSRAMEAVGVEPRLEGMSAWVESAWLTEAGIPAVCFGPGSIEHAHTAREFVPVEEILRCARVLERWVLEGGAGSGAAGSGASESPTEPQSDPDGGA
ncbi:MAG: M20/M25/M40 family metallo-hydrolase, partial [Gemmatimonadales bacterium]